MSELAQKFKLDTIIRSEMLLKPVDASRSAPRPKSFPGVFSKKAHAPRVLLARIVDRTKRI